jgi:hypothetical protein
VDVERPGDPGVTAGKPTDQRSGHPDEQKGLLEHPAPGARQAVRSVLCPARAGRADRRNLRAELPEPAGRGHRRHRPRRPGSHPADRHSRRSHPVSSGFTNFTGAVQADLLRLNTSIPPATTKTLSPLGVIGGDLAGFPNGRRVFDDVVTVELRAIAGATLPLVDPSFTPDAAVGDITDGLTDTSPGGPYLTHFPYLGVPYDGYDNPS